MKYRTLEPGETLRDGDEWYGIITDQWRTTREVGNRAGYGLCRRPVPEKPHDHRHVWVVEVWIGSQWQPYKAYSKRRAARLKARAVKWNGRLQTRIRKYVPEEVTR